MLIAAPTFRRAAISSASLALAATAFPQAAAAGSILPNEGASPVADSTNTLYLIVLVLGVLGVLAVIGGLVAFTRNSSDETSGTVATSSSKPVSSSKPGSSSKQTVLATTVLALALAIVGGIALNGATGADASEPGSPATYKPAPLTDPQLKVAHNVKPPKGPSISVHVNGQQYLWRYSYPSAANTYSYHTLVVPVGVTVMLDVTSSDVTHSWWVPQLGGAIEAVPGYINRGWIRADKAGTYEGASTTISGTNYPQMTTRVVAMPPAEFDRWLARKKDEIKGALDELAKQSGEGETQDLVSGEDGQTGLTGVRGDTGDPAE
ncbi:MAG: cytochrome c oxidase subunit II [Solirubrobacterales bacterium]